ncbi:helix-turn-helix transcriptional regulator [Bordetella sp. LUAb4]|uniref:helix-turn-helix domain-containing protein n=1 Tax=Bordetella sp. LUAb4 TaxID=2843195 RepID=UPI001E409982
MGWPLSISWRFTQSSGVCDEEDVNLVHERLKAAREHCETYHVKSEGKKIVNHSKKTAITAGTRNVFEDLGLPDAVERQTKTRLALAVDELIKSRKLKQRETAEVLGIPQPKVSALKNYRLDQFSIEKLMEFLTALNQDVEIMIRPRMSADVGHIAVFAAR